MPKTKITNVDARTADEAWYESGRTRLPRGVKTGDKKSNHKHDYENCLFMVTDKRLMNGRSWSRLGSYCRECGKIGWFDRSDDRLEVTLDWILSPDQEDAAMRIYRTFYVHDADKYVQIT